MPSAALLGARSSLIVFLSVSLMNIPIMAASAKPLGVVVTADHAHMDNVDAAVGASVYSGDALVTDEGGSLRLRIGTSELYVFSSSSATLAPRESKLEATVNRGSMGFSTSTPAQLEIETPMGAVRGADKNPVFGEVSLLSVSIMRISAYKGRLVVEGIDGQEKTIEEGQTYEANLAPDAAGGGPPRNAITGAGINWKHVADVAIPAAIVGGTAAIIWHFVAESNSAPPAH